MANRNTSTRNSRPRGGSITRGGEKPKDFNTTVKKFIRYLSKYKPAIIFVMFISACASLFRILGPKFLGDATDVLYRAVEDSLTTGHIVVDYIALGKVVAILVILYLISYLISVIRGFIMARVSNEITYNLRKDIDEKINRLPIEYFDRTSIGDVLSRITNDVSSINQAIREMMSEISSAITLMIGTIVMMLSISFKLTLIAFAMIPLSLMVISFVMKVSQPLYRKQQASLGMVNGHIEEMMSSHIVVKAFNMEDKSIGDFEVYNNELRENGWKSQMASNIMMPITNLISNAGYIMVCMFGAGMASNGQITVGNIQSFIQYIRNFNQPIRQLANISIMIQSAMACSERVFDFLEEKEEEPDTENPKSTENLEGVVTFKDVKFGYTEDKIIIDNFNLTVRPGEKIAIVGPTGAGKTTIVKLLMRYYELNDGEILIDGINIKDFTRNDLRSMFGMVLQETWLFKGSIRENIMYSKPDATEEELIKASEACRVHQFVSSLPHGYDFELNEESSNISQGQKQLLTIARAFLQNPKILILDEATSSVDTRTEVLIQEAMHNLMANRTSFVIAHRLSTIKDADKIIVLNHGRVEEIGNHTDLLAKGGFYAQLYKSQFEEA